jgi:integrase
MKYEKIKGNANHHLFRRGKWIWVRLFKAGRGVLERSLQTSELGVAQVRRDEQISAFLGSKPKWKGQALLVADAFPEFLELKKSKAKRTYESIKGHWDLHLGPYFGSYRVQDITESEWIRYVQHKRQIAAERKFFNDRKYLAMFLNWLHRNGKIPKLPMLEDVDPERKAGKIFEPAEIKRLLEHATGDLHLQILMAITMGMRKGEILKLECCDIDFTVRAIHLPEFKTKIRKARSFAISDACLMGLKARVAAAESGFVFPYRSNQKAWVSCKKHAGIIGRFHDLRHTFLTRSFKEAVNPALICHYAGLSLDEAEKTYLHFTIEDTRVVSSLIQIEFNETK